MDKFTAIQTTIKSEIQTTANSVIKGDSNVGVNGAVQRLTKIMNSNSRTQTQSRPHIFKIKQGFMLLAFNFGRPPLSGPV